MAFKEKKTPARAENPSDSEFIRRFKTNPFIFIGTILILIIVIVAFVLVPAIVPSGGPSGDLTFGSYDKVPISYVPGNFFAEYYNMLLTQYRQNSGDANYNQFADFELWMNAYQASLLRTAMLQEMKEAGYTAPVTMVDKQVAQQFYDETGHFSAEAYRSLDRNAQLALRRRTQDDIAIGHFYSDMINMLKPAAAAAFVKEMKSQQRTFDLVSFPVDNFPDTELLAYGEEHPDLFRQTHLSRITISASEREARQILASIKDGTTTFEDAARTHSRDTYAERGGDMGIKPAHALLVEIPEEAAREKILALAKGEFSDVIQIETQWAFFRMEDAVTPMNTADTAALDQIRSYVQNFERGRMENWAVEQAREFIALAAQDGFDSALDQRDIEKRSFGPVPVNYGNVDFFGTLSSASIPELYNSASDENFWKAAFSTPVNSVSEPLVQGSNVLVLFPTSEIEAEQSDIETFQSDYSFWQSTMLERSLAAYFTNSDKTEDRFMETFLRYLMPLPQEN